MKKLLLACLCAVAMICSAQAQNSSNIPVEFQGYAHVGTIFDAYGGGPTLDVDAGARIFNYFYVGLATGFHTSFAPSSIGPLWVGYVPIDVNLKGYFTKGKKFCPYVNCSLGGFIAVSGRGGGFHCQAGAGLEYERFSFGIGYNGFILNGTRADSGYIKLGIRFGKK